jgi:hypothetical protein
VTRTNQVNPRLNGFSRAEINPINHACSVKRGVRQLHGDEIELKTKLGEGSAFTIRLPVA